jgi:hypothetical protein
MRRLASNRNLIATLAGFAALACAASSAHAQLVGLPMRQCRSYFSTSAPAEIAKPGLVSPAEAQRLVKSIAAHAGVSPDFIVRPGHFTSSATAFTCYDGNLREIRRYIVYAPAFIEEIRRKSETYWSLVEVLAHEIGHHVNGHHLQRGRFHERELEADYFAGFVLARMGASLEQTTAGERALGSHAASATHPAREQRIEAMSRGWHAGRHGPPSSPEAAASTRSRRILKVPSDLAPAPQAPTQ